MPSILLEAHINPITTLTNARLANLRVGFRNMKEAFTTLYRVYVRSILEYTVPVWNAHLVMHVKKLSPRAEGYEL